MKDDRLFLVHMLELARRIELKVSGMQRAEFNSNDDLQLALTLLIQNVGEAARSVEPATRSSMPNVPWTSITGMRHRLVHDYTRIDLDIVWMVATERIPELIKLLAPVVDPIIASTKAKDTK